MMLKNCPKCKTLLSGADLESTPFEARVLLKGGFSPIGYDSHQDILFVMAPDEPPKTLADATGQVPETHMELRRYINVDRLSKEMKDAVMAEIRAKLPEKKDATAGATR
jgi:hypothetical protein